MCQFVFCFFFYIVFLILKTFAAFIFFSFVLKDMTGLECGHRFCSQCWMEYLTTKVMDEGMGQTISCAAHGCDILVDDATVM